MECRTWHVTLSLRLHKNADGTSFRFGFSLSFSLSLSSSSFLCTVATTGSDAIHWGDSEQYSSHYLWSSASPCSYLLWSCWLHDSSTSGMFNKCIIYIYSVYTCRCFICIVSMFCDYEMYAEMCVCVWEREREREREKEETDRQRQTESQLDTCRETVHCN